MPFLHKCWVNVNNTNFKRVLVRADVGVLWFGEEMKIRFNRDTFVSLNGTEAIIRLLHSPIEVMKITLDNEDLKEEFFRALSTVTQK
jgi:hypothetical protein